MNIILVVTLSTLFLALTTAQSEGWGFLVQLLFIYIHSLYHRGTIAAAAARVLLNIHLHILSGCLFGPGLYICCPRPPSRAV